MKRESIVKQRVAYYLSEFIGTFVMMAIGISAIILNFGTQLMGEVIPSNSVRLLLTGILFAGGATMVVYSPVGRIDYGCVFACGQDKRRPSKPSC
jgi:glycerol uptake facilitator-like aquaporin